MNPENKNQRIVFKEPETLDTIIRLLEKYGLKEKQEAQLEKLRQAARPAEKIRAAEELPARILGKLTKEVAENALDQKGLADQIQKQLNLSGEDAKKLSQDIIKNILPLAEWVPVEPEEPEEKGPQLTPEPAIEGLPRIEPSLRPPAMENKIYPELAPKPPTRPQPSIPSEEDREINQDIYREPIE